MSCASGWGIVLSGICGIAGSILVGLAATDKICNRNTRNVLAIIGLILLVIAFIAFTWYIYSISAFNTKQHMYLASIMPGSYSATGLNSFTIAA